MKKTEFKQGVVKIGSGLPVLHPHAAGIDIGSAFHCIAIPNGTGGHEVQTIGAFTRDLREIVGYLLAHGITTVAMESTGIYWLPLSLMLEEAGIEVYLVTAKHVKNVKGRKKDDTDAIWIQKLHTCGLLEKSFQPESEQRLLRSYTRQRKVLIQVGADCIRRLQRALELMNVKWANVLSDVMGKSGMAILKAILAGERDRDALYRLCDVRVQAPQETILQSLEGFWNEEHLFVLEQSLERYEFTQRQLQRCDAQIQEQLLRQVARVKAGDVTDFAELFVKKTKAAKNQFAFAVAPALRILTTIDLTKIPGIHESIALQFLAEVGRDMTQWQSSKHFAAWLNLAPNTKITGGKVISSKIMSKNNPAGQLLRQAASTLAMNKSPLGNYYRRMKAKLGGKGAVVATAHKLARIIYHLLRHQVESNPDPINQDQAKFNQNQILKLEKRLEALKKAV
jgi:transposase